MERWYVVFSKPRQESLAELHLRRQGYEVWFPRAQQSRRRRDRWIDTIEALFPRYLFLHVDLQVHSIGPIRSTRGVVDLVRSGLDPLPVPNEVVERLFRAVDASTGTVRIVCDLAEGDRVRVLSGPFAGLEGVFHAHSGKERVVILLDLLGRATRASLSRHRVMAVR